MWKFSKKDRYIQIFLKEAHEEAKKSSCKKRKCGAVIVKDGKTVLMIRLVEGKYPNYQQLIPQTLKKTFKINRSNLVQALKRVSHLSNQKSKGVMITLSNNNLKVASKNPDMGEALEELEIEYSGEEMKLGFNSKYLLDVLNSFNEEHVDLALNDQISPVLIRPGNDKSYTCIVMPMRI